MTASFLKQDPKQENLHCFQTEQNNFSSSGHARCHTHATCVLSRVASTVLVVQKLFANCKEGAGNVGLTGAIPVEMFAEISL